MKNGKSNIDQQIDMGKIKSFLKSNCATHTFFPKIHEYINSLELIKMKKIFNIEDLKIHKTQTALNDKEMTSNLYNHEIFLSDFSYENEYISKQFSFYQTSNFMKYILLSNFYKIFILNIPNTNASIVDFYSLLILVCPDFPKNIVKLFSRLFSIISNSASIDESNGLNKVKSNCTVNLILYFIQFSIFYFYYDYFQEVEKLFEMSKNILLLKDLIESKIILNSPIKEDIIYEILISCDNSLLKDYNLNTINTIEDVKEILEKYSNEVSITYSVFIEKIFKNYYLINEFFTFSDNPINKYLNVITNNEI